MFGRKRKQAAEKKRNDAWAAEEKKFDKAIEAAEQIKDPAEKILHLKMIQDQIIQHEFSERLATHGKGSAKGNNVKLAGFGAYGGGLVTACLVAGPIGWGALGVGGTAWVGSMLYSGRRTKSVIKKLQKESAGHQKCLQDKINRLEGTIDAVVNDNVEAISLSPYRKAVVADTSLAKKFAAAAAEKHRAAAEAPPAEAKQPEPQPPREPSDYSKLGKIFRPK